MVVARRRANRGFESTGMNPKEPSEPKNEQWNERERTSDKEKHADDDVDVMMITVPKNRKRCDVLYLNAASSSHHFASAYKASFPVGTPVEDMLERRPKNERSVFREYTQGEQKVRKLEPFTFDDDAVTSSSSEHRRRAPISPDEFPRSPTARSQPLRRSAKEVEVSSLRWVRKRGRKFPHLKSTSQSTKTGEHQYAPRTDQHGGQQ